MQNQPINGIQKGSDGAPGPVQKSGQGPAFRALLESLEGQSKGLAQSSEELSDASGLVDAVGQSQRALEQAKQLSDQLLEAFRARLQQNQ